MLAFIVSTILCGLTYLLLTTGSGVKMRGNSINLTPNILCVDIGDLNQAFSSMASDLRKHQDTTNHVGIELGMMLMISGELGTASEMRNFIDGFS